VSISSTSLLGQQSQVIGGEWSPLGRRQVGMVLQIQACRPLLDPSRQQVLQGVEGDDARPRRVVDRPSVVRCKAAHEGRVKTDQRNAPRTR
jgi:hypothetical protein